MNRVKKVPFIFSMKIKCSERITNSEWNAAVIMFIRMFFFCLFVNVCVSCAANANLMKFLNTVIRPTAFLCGAVCTVASQP